MANTTNTKAIVLGYIPWKEADRLYTVYTEGYGKQRLRAHGTQKIKSKLAGSLEPFAEIDMYLIQGKQMNKIGGAVVTQRFERMHTELEAQNGAWYCAELVTQLTEEGSKDQALYTLLYTALTWIDHHGAQRMALSSFAIKLVRLLGYDLAEEIIKTDISKIARWLEQESFDEVQKLRLSLQQWRQLQEAINNWYYQQLSRHIQTAKFLV